MQERTIDIGALLKFGALKYRHYFSFLIGAMITYFVLAVLPQVFYLVYDPPMASLSDRIISILFNLLQMLLTLGFTRVTLQLIDNEHTEVTHLFNNMDVFLSYFVATVIYMLLVFGGLILLVIPGIFAGIRLQFYTYYILEEQMNAFDALRASFEDTQGLTLQLFLFGLAAIVLNLAGMFFLGIGFMFTYPVTMMATAVIYRGLRGKASHIPTPAYDMGDEPVF